MHEFDSDKPIYAQLAEDIVKRAVRGELRPGDKIPSAREFAQSRLVNPNTVARAYQELERDGFVVTKRGLGSFVTEDEGRIKAARHTLVQAAVKRAVSELRALGLSGADIHAALADALEVRS